MVHFTKITKPTKKGIIKNPRVRSVLTILLEISDFKNYLSDKTN